MYSRLDDRHEGSEVELTAEESPSSRICSEGQILPVMSDSQTDENLEVELMAENSTSSSTRSEE